MRTDAAPAGTPYACLRCGGDTHGHGRYVPGTGAVIHRAEDDCRQELDAIEFPPDGITTAERWRPPPPPPDWLADTGVGFDDDLEAIRRSRARRRS